MIILETCHLCHGTGAMFDCTVYGEHLYKVCECVEFYIKHLEEHQYKITPATKKPEKPTTSGWDDMDDGSKIKLKYKNRNIEIGKCSLCGGFGCRGHGYCCK